MKKLFCWLYPLLFVGCGLANPITLSAETPKELFAVSEVARFSKMLHKDIKGVIAPKEYHIAAGVQGCPLDAPNGCSAAAWYTPSVIYFWQEFVNRESTTFNNLTDIAAHEVCHSMTPNHDQLLQNCILNLGADPQFVPHE